MGRMPINDRPSCDSTCATTRSRPARSSRMTPQSSELIERINSDDSQKLMPPPKSNRRLSADAEEAPGAMDHRGGRVRSALGLCHAQASRPSPRCGEPTGCAIRSTGLYSPSSKPRVWRRHRKPTGRRSSSGCRSIWWVYRPRRKRSMRSSPTPIPTAYDKLVDRLLASPHYGERMALGWLDAARYADSNGFQQDGDTWQWIWRDWVVRAMNQDLPFDQFTIWQLAGDLLPEATIDQKIASGFNRNHLLNGEGGAIAEEQRFVNLFDRDRHDRHDLAGADDGVRAMSRSQVRSRSPSAITTVCSTRSTACRRAARPSSSRREFGSRHRSSSSPPRKTRRGLPSSNPRSRRPNMIRSSPSTRPLKAGERASPPTAGPLRQRVFPTLWPRFSTSPKPSRTDDEKKSLDSGLRKHFDEKVRPGLAGKLPAIAKLDATQETTGRLPSATSSRASW